MNLQDIWQEIWRSLILIISGMVLLRLAGRKSISQMTIPTTIIMISIGTVIVQPIADKHITLALTAATVFIALLIFVEYLQLKWNWFEQLLKGSAKIVIRDGALETDTLNKLRLSVDQLEMKLRQAGVSRIEDIQTATIEPNGQLGYEWAPDAKPVTYGQMKQLLAMYMPNVIADPDSQSAASSDDKISLFDELNQEQEHVRNPQLQ